MNDAAFLFGLRARVGEEETLAANDGSFDHDEAAVFAGVDRVDLFVEGLLVESGTVDQDGNDVRMTQTLAMIGVGSGVGGIHRGSGAFARSFLLGLF